MRAGRRHLGAAASLVPKVGIPKFPQKPRQNAAHVNYGIWATPSEGHATLHHLLSPFEDAMESVLRQANTKGCALLLGSPF